MATSSILGALLPHQLEAKPTAARSPVRAAVSTSLGRPPLVWATPSPTATPAPEGPRVTPRPTPTSTPVPTPTPRPGWAGEYAPYHETGYVNGYPCGGELPTCKVLSCESDGNPEAENPDSTASGLWQITNGTWDGYGGYGHASHAPSSMQNDRAVELWAGGDGSGHWRDCL